MKKLFALVLAGLSGVATARAQTSWPTTNAVSAIELAWNPSVSAGVTNYTLWQGTASGNYTTNYNAGTNTILAVTNLLRGQTYYFAVSASGDGLTSAFSTEATYSSTLIPAAPTQVHVIVLSP